jgi:hypothetical protein
MKTFCILVFAWLIALPSPAQQATFKVQGKVVDKTDNSALPGATVLFRSVKDSSAIRAGVTDAAGLFAVSELAQAFYRVRVQSLGYKSFTKIVRLRSDMDLGAILLERDTKVLDNVEVIGEVVPMERKGDTLLYNADAFKVNPDANATDLVRKMPGIVVDNSGVTANGEKIEQVLMDGKRFFGQDPLLSLNTIPAEVVNKVEVFDQMSERSQFTGFNDGNTTKTMNVVTKEDKRNGLFGELYGGYGTNERYSAGLNLNSFKKDRQLTLLGISNNINQLNFAEQDIVGAGTGGGSRRGFRSTAPGGAPGGSNFLTSNQDGITTTNASGINFSENLGAKATFEGSYFFNHSNNSNDQVTAKETFREAGSQFYDESRNASTENENHRLNMRIAYNINDKNRLVYIPAFSYQDNSSLEYTLGQTTTASEEVINGTENNYESANTGFNFTNNVMFQHKFEKIGRSISVNVNSRISKTDRENYYEDFSFDSLTQYLTDENANIIGTKVTYAEPVGLNGELSASYSINYNNRNSDKKTYLLDPEDGEKEFSGLLSNKFNSRYTTQMPTLMYSNRSFGQFFNAALSFQRVSLGNEQTFPEEGSYHSVFQGILPSAMGRFELKGGTNMFFRYNTSTNQPSIGQLQNVIDNSNPLFFSIGNPALRQSYSHSLMMRINKTNTDKNKSISNFTRIQNTSNYITNATDFAAEDTVLMGGVVVQKGTQISMPVNLSGYWNISNNTTYSLLISQIKSNLNTSLGLGYVRKPGRTEGLINISNNYSLNFRLGLSSNISKQVDFNTYYRIAANRVFNSIQEQSNTGSQYITQTIGGKLNLIFWKGFVFRNDIYFEHYNGMSDSFNSSYVLWNISIARKFLKNDLAEIEITAFDILDQNQRFNQAVTPNYVEEVRTEVLKQYVMLKLSYRLRKFRSAT